MLVLEPPRLARRRGVHLRRWLAPLYCFVPCSRLVTIA
uniref:Myb8 n=1 Tax=Arundo donax TaxID=35708 RepID=A0A0A9HDT3_ARUDO